LKPLPLKNPPESVCLLRLSAIGDVCHAVPVIRTLQKAWPETRLTWIVGKTEYDLVGDIPGVEFIIFDKAAGWRAWRDLRRVLRDRHFDVLLHMQMSLRASLASLAIPADIRLGFDRERANDLQWLFTNARIPHVPRQHVLESFLEFPRALGIDETVLEWNIPIPEGARQKARELAPTGPYVIISPCSAHAYRNWTPEGYAAVADYLWEKWQLPVLLTGGPSTTERRMAQAILARSRHRPRDLTGHTDLKTLLALLAGARLLISPDSGPAHMATTVGTPVVGLYAATNPERARPYCSPELVVNGYPDAVRQFLGKDNMIVPWGTRIRQPAAMSLIRVPDVLSIVEKAMGSPQNMSNPVSLRHSLDTDPRT